jgi:hypothetical protein
MSFKIIPIRASYYFALFGILNIYISVDTEHQIFDIVASSFVILTSPMFSFIKR